MTSRLPLPQPPTRLRFLPSPCPLSGFHDNCYNSVASVCLTPQSGEGLFIATWEAAEAPARQTVRLCHTPGRHVCIKHLKSGTVSPTIPSSFPLVPGLVVGDAGLPVSLISSPLGQSLEATCNGSAAVQVPENAKLDTCSLQAQELTSSLDRKDL